MTTHERFQVFCGRLVLTPEQRADGVAKHQGVTRALNAYYWSSNSETVNGVLVGSWGKGTQIRPPRDIDILFSLPWSVHQRFELRLGNKQSQLLQEVKDVLQKTYPRTEMRADGQVVIVPFTTYAVEVAPGFQLMDRRYWICDTNGGGRYRTTHPEAEIAAVTSLDLVTNGNGRNLIRMLKRWQDHCFVPLKSFWIELLVSEFLANWPYRMYGCTFYDWMVRDFFGYLLSRVNGSIWIPGIVEYVPLGDAWRSKAESARDRAFNATDYEARGMPWSAGEEWQKIFGTDIPQG